MLLSPDEIKALEKFRLSTTRTASLLSIRVDRLFHERTLLSYLEAVQQKIRAANKTVAASIFMKRYSFIAVMSLYAMSVWNKRLSLSFDRIWIETDDEEKAWLPTFRFEKLEYEVTDGNRNAWRQETIRLLFAEHIFPVIEQLQKMTKISPLTLWENTAIYIFWLYETLLKDEALEDINARLRDDFQFVVQQADGTLFGSYPKNPLGRFWKETNGIRQRTTCCLHYQTAARSHCRTCPVRRP
ncbi:siderophore-iron reductase FhuF [Thermaerobacillus caldiproteolyticus]|uniref:siderophore-iron reductase FhuF n=1 Tax=Thermaerobacillus caldiproteolyticus TaxID=247480 RepID=UPI00188DB42F|nr:siderophore-iron reductase FhuF [Anoxybacillus caldiproteolyticus]QPA32844.1 siderophore-iron reductase FhuF [Anoxybacillus caldiproteolyticus]